MKKISEEKDMTHLSDYVEEIMAAINAGDKRKIKGCVRKHIVRAFSDGYLDATLGALEVMKREKISIA